ncbi:MAG: hypothetical protein QW261_16560 [Candidatus Jordarchaeaceae archaeon]
MLGRFEKEIFEGEVVYRVRFDDGLGVSGDVDKLFNYIITDITRYDKEYANLKYTIRAKGVTQDELDGALKDYCSRLEGSKKSCARVMFPLGLITGVVAALALHEPMFFGVGFCIGTLGVLEAYKYLESKVGKKVDITKKLCLIAEEGL